MTRNVELLQQTMQHILDHPEQHDQTQFVNDCGTAACFAGRACLLSGLTPLYGFPFRVVADGLDMSAWEAAIDLLGLTADEGWELFHGRNSVSVLQQMVADLVRGNELRPFEVYEDEVH